MAACTHPAAKHWRPGKMSRKVHCSNDRRWTIGEIPIHGPSEGSILERDSAGGQQRACDDLVGNAQIGEVEFKDRSPQI